MKDLPITIVIFGGTGDLAKKKLFSALLDLHVGGHLSEGFRVVGFSNEEYSHEEYRNFVKEALEKKGHDHGEEVISKFLNSFYFHNGDLLNPDSYKAMQEFLGQLDGEAGECPNRIFYLAVPPTLYAPVFENVAATGLHIPCQNSWTRLLVEKPFGNDLKTARSLDRKLGELYQEDQIFRIDHYIAKEAVQNLLTFRFSNTLFENSWSRHHIRKVHVKLYENNGIEGRGSFYSATGALRDVGQNHMLQILALIAMENPGSISAESLQKTRENVLNSLHVLNKEEVSYSVIKGQYEGYKEVEGVGGEGCSTETYFLLKAFIDNDRWSGVPFYLESGKGLSEDLVEIEIDFSKVQDNTYGGENQPGHRNTLKLTLQPEEKVNMTFWTKKPGLTHELESKDLSFVYGHKDDIRLPDAYEKVLYDCIKGDQTLFVSTREVESAWEFITSIMDNWNDLPLYSYERGGNGPVEKDKLLGKE